MKYTIEFPEFEGKKLKLIVPKYFGEPKVFFDDFEVQKVNDRYSINNNVEKPFFLTLKRNILDPVPRVFINNKPVQVVKPLKWYEYVWTGLPILLFIQGGLLGALMGFVALRLNIDIFRCNKSLLIKYIITLAISLVTVAIYFTIAILLSGMVPPANAG